MNRNKYRLKSRLAFTMIELMVVIMIIAILGALVAVRLGPTIDQSRQTTAQAQIGMLGDAIRRFKMDTGSYPTTDVGLIVLRENKDNSKFWKGPYLQKRIPLDPWGNKYQYICPGQHCDFDIISFGADGTQGGEGLDEDIVNWKSVGEAEGEYY